MRALRRQHDGVRLDPASPEPALAPGEALIRPLRMAIASPDLAAADGSIGFVGVLGHAFVGVVERVSSSSEDRSRWEGRRVVSSIDVVCAACERCRAGLSAHCPDRTVVGLYKRDGCFADRVALPVSNLIEVPKGVPDEAASMAHTLAGALHAAHVLRVEGKPYVTVLGDGPMGLLTGLALARRNASVRVVGRHPEKYALAEKWGLKHRHADDVGRRQDQDVVVDCTGSPAGLNMALGLVRPRGKVLLRTCAAPIPAPALPPVAGWPDLARAVINEVDIIGSRGGNLGDALGELARNEWNLAPLVSGRSKLADSPEALNAARRGSCLTILLEP